tara:strand:- start:932 stop:1099 length:168 start_codon:yes stop_codon:yes gene_type:complete
MEKEDVTLLAQLLTGMKSAIEKIEKGQKKSDLESISFARKELIDYQAQIDKILRK